MRWRATVPLVGSLGALFGLAVCLGVAPRVDEKPPPHHWGRYEQAGWSCGSASLYLCCRALGRPISMNEFEAGTNDHTGWVTMLDLKRAAERLGVPAQGYRGTWRSLRRHLADGACAILHVDGDHFIAVVASPRAQAIRVADPKSGIGDVDWRAFRANYDWAGVMLVLRSAD